MGDGDGEAFERFLVAVEAALEEEDLLGIVSTWIENSARARPTAEIVEITASPMRQGHGSKALRAILRVADEMGVRMILRVANEADDFRSWDEGDPARPPSELELVEWYGRFGFEILSYMDETVMARDAQPVPVYGSYS